MKIREIGWFSFCLRVGVALAAACVCAGLLMAQSGGITAKDAKAKEALSSAIKALGGADKTGGIKSLVIKGTWAWLPQGRALGMEIRILLPDSFVQIHQVDMGSPFYRGISRGTLIPPPNTEISPYSLDGSLVPPEITEAFAKRLAIRIDYDTNAMADKWSRFLIGTLMKSDSTPITISSGSASGVFSLTKSNGAVGEIEFDPKTGYPVVIRYKNPVSAGGPGIVFNESSKTKPNGSAKTDITSARPSENMDGGEIRFRDHFSINGIMFPKIITSTEISGGITTTEELRIEEVLFNPELSLKDFEIPQR